MITDSNHGMIASIRSWSLICKTLLMSKIVLSTQITAQSQHNLLSDTFLDNRGPEQIN
jgi:hypothetical protein